MLVQPNRIAVTLDTNFAPGHYLLAALGQTSVYWKFSPAQFEFASLPWQQTQLPRNRQFLRGGGAYFLSDPSQVSELFALGHYFQQGRWHSDLYSFPASFDGLTVPVVRHGSPADRFFGPRLAVCVGSDRVDAPFPPMGGIVRYLFMLDELGELHAAELRHRNRRWQSFGGLQKALRIPPLDPASPICAATSSIGFPYAAVRTMDRHRIAILIRTGLGDNDWDFALSPQLPGDVVNGVLFPWRVGEGMLAIPLPDGQPRFMGEFHTYQFTRDSVLVVASSGRVLRITLESRIKPLFEGGWGPFRPSRSVAGFDGPWQDFGNPGLLNRNAIAIADPATDSIAGGFFPRINLGNGFRAAASHVYARVLERNRGDATIGTPTCWFLYIDLAGNWRWAKITTGNGILDNWMPGATYGGLAGYYNDGPEDLLVAVGRTPQAGMALLPLQATYGIGRPMAPRYDWSSVSRP